MPPETVLEPEVVTPAIAEVANFEQRVDALTPKAKEHWQLTGDIDAAEALGTTKSVEPPAPEPGIPSEDSQEPETEAASEPATEEQPKSGESPEQKSERKRRNDANRLIRLNREAAEWKAKYELLASEKAGQGKPDNAAPAPATAKTSERPKRPRMTDPQFQGDKGATLYDEALDKYESDLDAYNRQFFDQRLSSVKQEAAQAVNQTVSQQKLQEQFAQARKTHADYDAVAFSDKVPASFGMIHVLDGLDNGAEVRYQVGKNLAEATRIADLTYIPGEEKFQTYAEFDKWIKSDPERAMLFGEKRAMAKAELSKLSKPQAALPPRTAARPKPTAEVDVTGKGTAVEDEEAEAIRTGNQEAYERIVNRRDAENFKAGVR